MNNQPPVRRTPGADPLLGAPVGNRDVRGPRPDSATPRGAAGRSGSGSPRRQHPARGARALALAASIVATGAVGAALAYSEGALRADSDVAASGSTDLSITSTSTADSTAAAASTVVEDVAATASTEAPDTTTAADVAEDGAAASGYADGEYLGTAEYTEWGDVQVQVTISNGGIVDVTAVQYPTGRKSDNINSGAIPLLEADAVAMQSADLDIVSGATYTSRTYADSLQAALDQASLAAAQEGASS